jgi:two-component system, chemotaxis family, protein-glutamate methylesterase/glutaminase
MTRNAWKAVVIGGSAGAFDAISAIFQELPVNFPLPVLVVLHLPPIRESMVAESLRRSSNLPIIEAQDKEPILPGTIYVAPPDYHLLVESRDFFALSFDPPCHNFRPSIDVLFESAADAYDGELIGVVLSGANDDGAHGLQTIVAQGGLGLVQSPEEAYARVMPMAAIEACPGVDILDAREIGNFLKENCHHE